MPSTERPTKRTKTAPPAPSIPALRQPRLFAPFRALGFISNHIPFALQVRSSKGAIDGPNFNVVTCLGRSWAMWEGGKMGLLFVGPEAPVPIASLAAHGNAVFASAGPQVIRYFRGRQVATYESPDPSINIGQILIFAQQLLGLREDGKGFFIWNIETMEIEGEVLFHPNFTGTTMLHPATYLNKIIIGGLSGELQIWNTQTISIIHSFPAPKTPSPITTITQSPAIDVLAVGSQDGSIVIQDIRAGEVLFRLKMEEGAIAGLSFRMDGPPILASCSTTGTVAIWDLNEKGKILHTLRDAHDASVTGLQWVSGQPLLISSSVDNSIKQWVCDADTAVPRLLKFRTGHHAPVGCLRYYGDDGKQILTAGRDRALRYTSVVRDSRSHELSQGSLLKKANSLSIKVETLKYQPATAIASSSTRSKDWEDVVTAHVDDSYARTWRVQDKRVGRWSLDIEDGIVQAVCVTACGNYSVAGSSTGQIKLWNMQSGQERKSFYLSGVTPPTKKGKAAKPAVTKRTGKAVTGLATDALNRVLVASTLDGVLHFFDFHTTNLEHTIQMPSKVTAISLHRDSGLLAVTCDDMVVRLLDIETRRIVREMAGFKGRVLDVTFSPDSRWLITSSLDSVIRTFDVPTGQLVDAFRTSSIASSLTFSPTGDFLASAHVDSVGVFLWANKAQFSEVSLRHIEEDDVFDVALPSVQGLEDDGDLAGITPVGAPEHHDIYTTPEQLTESMLTLSLMPRSRWQTLLNLETIKQRNKPKEAPKAPEKAPFFLPTISGLQTTFDLSASTPEQRPSPFTSNGDIFVESDFTRRLALEDASGDYNVFFEYMKALSPAAIDLEIRSLLSLQHLELFLRALVGRLRSHRDFEAVQAFLNVCVTVHGDILIANEELGETLKELQAEQKKESKRLMELISYSLGTLAFIRSA